MASDRLAAGKHSARIPRNVVWLGLVSFLNDFSSEMIYPLLPLFFTRVLGASPAALGAMEGILVYVILAMAFYHVPAAG